MELFELLGKIVVENAEALKALLQAQKEGEKTEGKFSKAFKAIGKGAAAVGKAIAKGLVAGATACIGLATAAINAYGDYEQLVGGVETLFGTRGAKSVEEYASMVGKSVADVKDEFGMLEQAQSLAMENASNAYKTAGLSMNDYMETANGLAAALNQSSGSQLESARLADQAIIDMADNSAKMGTSMEAIQTAYAGFSKQNYTMLDNLKLGYGGTKEEMQRLLDDAEKISGIKYDLSSFADVTEAIHVMQEEMGIAGTTAAEASGTIQGSFGMLKGAWSNLLVGLSDPEANLTSLIDNVFNSVNTFAGNLIPRISQVLLGIATSIQTLVPMLAGEIPGLLNQLLPSLIVGATALVNGLVSALPGVLDAIIQAAPMLIDAVVNVFDQLVTALPQLVQTIVSALPTLIPALIDGIVSMITTLASNLTQIIEPIVTALPDIIVAIVEALVTNLPVLIEGAIQLTLGLVAAIPQIIQALVDAIPMIVSLLVQALIENLPLLIAGVVQLVAGLVAAVGQIFSSLVQAVVNVFVGIWDAIKNALAPVKEWFSNLWQSLGNVPGLAQLKTMVEQVWNAIKSFISTVVGAIKDVVSTYWNAIKDVVSTVINSIKNVISTVWDAIKTVVSNVMKAISSVLKGDWEGVKEAISNILDAIKSVISSIWNGIKDTISSVLNGIKDVVSSIWNGIKSVITSYLDTIKSVVSSVWNGIKSAISTVLNGIKSTVTSAWSNIKSAISNAVTNIKNSVVNGFNNLKTAAINVLRGMISSVTSVGKDLVKGIWSGISGSLEWIKGKIKGWVGNVTKFIKNLFGIKSPSRVMRDEVGQWLAKGIAEGITQHTNSATDAMADLGKDVLKVAKENAAKAKDGTADMNKEILDAAKKKLEAYTTYNELTAENEAQFWDFVRQQCAEGSEARVEADKNYFAARSEAENAILETAEKKLAEYTTYNKMTLAEEVRFWEEISLLCEKGTDARLKADQKYLDAHNKLNDELLKAEETLQKSLEEIHENIAEKRESILGKFDLFEEFNPDEAPDFMTMFESMNNQIVALETYGDDLEALRGRIGDTSLFAELEGMGLDGAAYVERFAEMTDDQMDWYISLYDKRNALANEIAEESLAKQSIEAEKKAWEEYAKTCEELGVAVVRDTQTAMGDVSGAVATTSIVLSRATELGTKSITSFVDKAKSDIDSLIKKLDELQSRTMFFATGVSDYIDTASVLDTPTVFSYNSSDSSLVGGSVGVGLIGTVEDAIAKQGSEFTSVLSNIHDAIVSLDENMGGHLSDALENTALDINNREFARLVKAVKA